MAIPADILQQAIDLYLHFAYPPAVGGAETVPPGVATRISPIRALPPTAPVPEPLLEKETSTGSNGFALRLGQPLYPHMKLIIEPAPQPCGPPDAPCEMLLRVDTHDRHLHAPPGSPDEVWLASIRTSNKQLTEQIEAAWSRAHLPTFKDYLRRQLDAKKASRVPSAPASPRSAT
jgi:hypothetical protein